MTSRWKARGALAAGTSIALFVSWVSAQNATSSDTIGMGLWWGVVSGAGLVFTAGATIAYVISEIEGLFDD